MRWNQWNLCLSTSTSNSASTAIGPHDHHLGLVLAPLVAAPTTPLDLVVVDAATPLVDPTPIAGHAPPVNLARTPPAGHRLAHDLGQQISNRRGAIDGLVDGLVGGRRRRGGGRRGRARVAKIHEDGSVGGRGHHASAGSRTSRTSRSASHQAGARC